MHRVLIAVLLIASFQAASANIYSQDQPLSVPVVDLGKGHLLIGKLHQPLGKAVRVQGLIVHGPDKGFEGGLQMRVQRINGQATQEDIQILLDNETGVVKPDEFSTVRPLAGKSYELQGYESGGYIGHPGGIWKNKETDPGHGGAWVQTVPHYFRLEFHYVRGFLIDPVTFTPADFAGRQALLQGIARDANGAAVLDGGNWQVIVEPNAVWSKDWLGKPVETLGLYSLVQSADSKAVPRYSMADGVCRLSNLSDQTGQLVELRGTARQRNDVWWFDYRGTSCHIENIEQLPGWNKDMYNRPILIRGRLERAKLPRLDQIGLKSDRDMADQWIVRNASWKPLTALLAPERPNERD